MGYGHLTKMFQPLKSPGTANIIGSLKVQNSIHYAGIFRFKGQHMETTAGQQQLTNQHLHSGQHPEVPQHRRHSPVSNNRVNTEDEEEDEDDEDDEEDEEEDSLSGSHNVPPGSSFDYFGAVGNQSHQVSGYRPSACHTKRCSNTDFLWDQYGY